MRTRLNRCSRYVNVARAISAYTILVILPSRTIHAPFYTLSQQFNTLGLSSEMIQNMNHKSKSYDCNYYEKLSLRQYFAIFFRSFLTRGLVGQRSERGSKRGKTIRGCYRTKHLFSWHMALPYKSCHT